MTVALPGRLLAGDEIGDAVMSWPSRRTAVAHGRISNFVQDEVVTPSGETIVREYITHPGAVAVIALDDADRVAVVAQYRHPAGFRFIEPPAGLLDALGEPYVHAAQRELAEEATLVADDWRVLVDVFTSPGCNEESIRVFLARGLREGPRPDGFVLEHEEADMEAAWVPLVDLVSAIYAGRVQNPTMVIGALALHAARLDDRVDDLRPADAPWPARGVKADVLDARA